MIKTTVRELGKVITGHTPPTSKREYYGSQYLFLKPTDMIIGQKYTYVTEEGYSALGAEKYRTSLIPKGSTCVVCIGTLGEKMSMAHKDLFTNQSVNSIIPGDNYDQHYVYYLLKHNLHKVKALNKGTASGREFVSKTTFLDLEIDVIENLNSQKKIGEILSAYDNLIENNQKQIKLLEEAARRLYKEWFADLRFPGYENTPIVDGVPEGWKQCLLGDINCSLESGSRPKGGIDASLVDGVPSIGAENVIGLGCYNYSSEKLITKDFFSKMKRGKLCDKDILIYKDGAYIGRTSLFQDGFPHLEAAVNEHVFLLHAADEHFQYYLFFTLYQQEYYQKMQKLNKNAAQPGINSKAMMSLPVLLPTEDILDRFDSFTMPLMHKIFNLAKQNRQLELARDRLLPKLMSGEIEV